MSASKTVCTNLVNQKTVTALKMKFFIKDFFNKCDHLLKQFLMENLTFCAVF